ncbi:hypothetical protein ACRYCC_34920 [Actinomadura scrupuli]|uniref:hypothetical protein n=1 Tax=Actinomadura scrupuli TaxID=559629 RepID=UPI003D970872
MTDPPEQSGDAGHHRAGGERGPAAPPPKEEKAPEPEHTPEERRAEEERRKAEEERDEAVKGLRESEDPRSRAESAQINAILKEAFRRFGQRGPDVHMKVNFFQDSVEFGGGLNMGGGSTPAPGGGGELDAAWVKAHVEHFVRPAEFDATLRILTEHRLVLLADVPGAGCTAAAINLLTSASSRSGTCYQIPASAELAAASWEPPTKEMAYLVDLSDPSDASPVRAADLGGGWIERIAARLRTADSHMVVLTGPADGALADASMHSPCVVSSLGALDLMEVVVRRVLGRSPSTAERGRLVDQVTAGGGAALLAEWSEPRVAVHLADALRAGDDLATVVAQLRDSAPRVRSWFGRQRDPAAMAFALAAAMLEDATYLTVSDAAAELHRLLVPSPGDVRPPRLRFRERLGSDPRWIVLRVAARRGDPERVRFTDATLREAVLEYAWLHLDGEREALLRWIRRLINDPDFEVRTSTAVSMSLFARHDHVHAVRRYLRPWAADDSERVRESAAMTMAMLGADPDLTDIVWKELDLWTDEVNPRLRLRTTAAATVGGPLGADRPEHAFRILRCGLDDDTWRGLGATADGVGRLIELECDTEALRALVEWSDPVGDPEIVQQALLIFVFTVFAPLPWTREPEGAPGAPLVIADHGRNRRRLTRLLGRALGDETARDYALTALRRCFSDHADHDARAREALSELLLGVAALNPRQAKRITYHLDRWARDPVRPSPGAKAVHAALTHSTSTRTPK